MAIDQSGRGLTLRAFKRTTSFCAAILLMVAAVSCERKSNLGQHAAVSGEFPFSERIGWLHGPCLAIANPNLAHGTPVALVITATPQRVLQTQIQEQTNSPGACEALMEGRGTRNAKAGMSFYKLETGSVDSSEMGFGIVKPPSNLSVVNGLAQVDLDQNGHNEVFSSCATTEGIKFAVWTDKAYQGESRWSGYYYLDYETKPTCP